MPRAWASRGKNAPVPIFMIQNMYICFNTFSRALIGLLAMTLQASCKAPVLGLAQVLLNLEPRSFAAACQPTSWQQIKRSVTLPGVSIADEILPPDLVRAPPE